MTARHLRGLALVAAAAVSVSPAWAAQVMKGTLLAPVASAGFLRLQVDGAAQSVKPAQGAKIMRGQIGKDVRSAALADLAAGDHIVAVVDQNGRASSVKAFYGRVQGNFRQLDGNVLALEDGRRVPLAENPEVVMPDGKPGKVSDLRPGALVVCRVNPVSDQAWTVVSAAPTRATEPAATSAAQPTGARVEIRSVTYSAPSPLRPGDLLTVDMAGTPGCKASFSVKGLLASTLMKETSAGAYRAVVEVPKGKQVKDAPLLGSLESGAAKAGPVQASRLITVDSDITAASAKPTTPRASGQRTSTVSRLPELKPTGLAAASVPPVAQAPASDVAGQPSAPAGLQSSSSAPPGTGSIAIRTPAAGSKIRRSIQVSGTAEPDSRVQVTITYNNGLTGILRLAGQVAAQLLAVDRNGEFRMSPIPLEGPLATSGLRFTIKVWYPDRADHSTAQVVVVGDRA